jgi:tripartite-type tricarboxylate transporter receptor subunit TctC
MRRPTAKFLPMLFAAAIFMPLTAGAADWKPKGTMTAIVASGAGGAYDVLQRAMSKHWVKYFGVKVIVKNMKGAGGSLGMNRIATSKPDGQIIGFSSRSPYLGELLKRNFPWNIEDIPVIMAAKTPPYAFSVSTKSKFNSWEDLRSLKRKVRLGVASQLSTELLIVKDLVDHGRNVTTASMKTTELIQSTIAGDLDIWNVVTSKTFMDPYKAGDIKPLVFLSEKRDSRFPNVPTHIELGMPAHWTAFQAIRMWYAPIGTPKNIISSIEARMTKLLNDPGIKGWAEKSGFVKGLISGKEAKARQVGAVAIIKKNMALYKKYGG